MTTSTDTTKEQIKNIKLLIGKKFIPDSTKRELKKRLKSLQQKNK